MSQLQEHNITGRESVEIKQGLVNFSKQQYKDIANKQNHHPAEWWLDREYPERAKFLTEVCLERDDDSEDGYGKKVYIKERCPKFQAYQETIEKKKTKNSIQREDVLKHNKKLKPGMQPVVVPAIFQPD